MTLHPVNPLYLPQPNIRVLGEVRRGSTLHRLEETFTHAWSHRGVLHRITAEAGFEFDGASIPALVRPIFGGIWTLGKIPPLMHDLKYFHRGRLPWGCHEILIDGDWVDALQRADGLRNTWPRRDADRFFFKLMREGGVKQWKRRAAYRGVRAAVWKSWDEAPWDPHTPGDT